MVELENIIIVYHYVRDKTNFKAFTTSQFREQVSYLSKNYRIIGLSELIEQKPRDKTCVITFDDGIKDGFTNALPILEEHNAKATFFIPGGILTEKKVLNAQKRHLLLAKLGTEKFVEEFNSSAESIFRVREESKKQGYQFDDALTSNLKYMLDNMDNPETVLTKIFGKYFNEEEEFEKIYLNKQEMKKMQGRNMEFGCHGYNHIWLGKLYFKDMKSDIEKGLAVFQENFPDQIKTISYPFGSYSPLTVRLAKELGFKAGLTIEKRINENTENMLELGRFDCVDILKKYSN
ncbi:MAG: polysaccharide deacetylase family protein [Candidatus Diapherotrites archaeon]|nr:polysaccharide deacetylase family protein [Candidatus Diapherotrites archaeon]